MSDDRVICHKCSRLVRRGAGEFYLVQIRAVADPEIRDIPELSHEQLAGEIQRLIDEASRQSERELREQVHAEFEITLCAPCYRAWIENPTG